MLFLFLQNVFEKSFLQSAHPNLRYILLSFSCITCYISCIPTEFHKNYSVYLAESIFQAGSYKVIFREWLQILIYRKTDFAYIAATIYMKIFRKLISWNFIIYWRFSNLSNKEFLFHFSTQRQNCKN